MAGIFEKYGERYGFDHLMLAALAYQESGLDQNVRSRAGAIGRDGCVSEQWFADR